MRKKIAEARDSNAQNHMIQEIVLQYPTAPITQTTRVLTNVSASLAVPRTLKLYILISEEGHKKYLVEHIFWHSLSSRFTHYKMSSII